MSCVVVWSLVGSSRRALRPQPLTAAEQQQQMTLRIELLAQLPSITVRPADGRPAAALSSGRLFPHRRRRVGGGGRALVVTHRVVDVAHARRRERDRHDGDVVAGDELRVRRVALQVDRAVLLADLARLLVDVAVERDRVARAARDRHLVVAVVGVALRAEVVHEERDAAVLDQRLILERVAPRREDQHLSARFGQRLAVGEAHEAQVRRQRLAVRRREEAETRSVEGKRHRPGQGWDVVAAQKLAEPVRRRRLTRTRRRPPAGAVDTLKEQAPSTLHRAPGARLPECDTR
mmetsp:Transcript_21341/g.57484  ORF Transcript_21341/g.57484 Transcript_21341/m.57484 type:complete len:291 (+) Transcript_21341:144-1016(+)